MHAANTIAKIGLISKRRDYLMRILQADGLPDGVINLVYGSGATIGSVALASPDLAGIHFTGSTEVFNGMWETVGHEHRLVPELPAHRR